MITGDIPQEHIAGLRRFALPVGIVAAVALVIAGFFDPAAFFRAYLYAYVFWLGIALGSLALVMLHHITGGAWGFVIRRICEAASMTLPLMAVLFVPFCFGLRYVYPWMDAALVAADPVLHHKAPLFTPLWFVGRSVAYFAVWAGFAVVFRRWSLAQDRTGEARYARRFQFWSGPGLILYVVTMSLAAIDWLMSLETRWFSTIFGMLIVTSQGLTAFAFAILIAIWLARKSLFHQLEDAFYDLGGLLMAFVVLWVYMAYSQYIIIWSGNLPPEISFYLHRRDGGWALFAIGMIVLHFAIPFIGLMFGALKRNQTTLAFIAWIVLAGHLLDTYWLVLPTFHPQGFTVNLPDILAPIAIGGLWLAAFARALQGKSLVPLHDPRLENRPEVEAAREALQHE